MAHEITYVQSCPQVFVRFKRQRVQRKQGQCFGFASLNFSVCIGGTTAQGTQGVAVQVFEQLAFPSVPHFGAGAANIGHSQQVQSGKVALIAHTICKGLDDVGIAEVLLLSNVAHRQMLSHQELNEFGVFFGNVVIAGKSAHLKASELRMVAATSFGDVMKQRAGKQNPRLVPTCGKLRTEWVFMRMLGHEKSARITQHHQNMLVHRVDVKQVMLHLPHDAAERPKVAAKHRGLVHQAHGVRDANWRLQNTQKHGPVHGVLAKFCIHQTACVVERTQGAR